ncbi:S-protein homolog 4 [Linum grandiflorum]
METSTVEARSNPFDPRKPKVTVVIVNDVGKGRKLKLHCKSGDNDLGLQILSPHDSFKFKFRPSMIGTTRFYCAFSWDKGSDAKWFDVYHQQRDAPGNTFLEWSISPDGPCRPDKGGQICYQWNH